MVKDIGGRGILLVSSDIPSMLCRIVLTYKYKYFFLDRLVMSTTLVFFVQTLIGYNLNEGTDSGSDLSTSKRVTFGLSTMEHLYISLDLFVLFLIILPKKIDEQTASKIFRHEVFICGHNRNF